MAEKSYLSNTKTFQLESFLHSGRPFFAFSVNTILIHEIMYPIDIQRFTNNESKTFFVSSRYVLACPTMIYWKLDTAMIQASFSVDHNLAGRKFRLKLFGFCKLFFEFFRRFPPEDIQEKLVLLNAFSNLGGVCLFQGTFQKRGKFLFFSRTLFVAKSLRF